MTVSHLLSEPARNCSTIPNCSADCAVVWEAGPVAVQAGTAPGTGFQSLLVLIGIAGLLSVLPDCGGWAGVPTWLIFVPRGDVQLRLKISEGPQLGGRSNVSKGRVGQTSRSSRVSKTCAMVKECVERRDTKVEGFLFFFLLVPSGEASRRFTAAALRIGRQGAART